MSHKEQMTIQLTVSEDGQVGWRVDETSSPELQVLSTAIMMLLHDKKNLPVYLEAAEKHIAAVLEEQMCEAK